MAGASFLAASVIVEIPHEPATTKNTVLRVRIEDISIADRASTPLAEVDVALPEVPSDHEVTVQFDLPPHAIDERSLYSIAAHLDMNGSGDLESGDAFTTQTYPVLTHGAPDTVHVRLTPLS